MQVAPFFDGLGVFGPLFLLMAGGVVVLSLVGFLLRARPERTLAERRVAFLLLGIAGAFPVAGLTGTVLGLLRAFAGVERVAPADKAAQLSEGISQAMRCTAFGLGLSVPAAGLAVIALVSSARRARRVVGKGT